MRHRHLMMTILAVLSLLLAACGGQQDDGAAGGQATEGGAAGGATEAGATEPAAGAGGQDYQITLIPGVIGDEFYVTMECGAREAAEELGVSLDVQGADEFAAPAQLPILQAVAAQQPDAILIAPTDVQALQGPIEQAAGQDIEIVLVDTTLDDPSVAVSRIASDNVEGGRQAAQALAELIGEEGPVMVVNVNPGISTTDARQQGFEEAIAEYENIEYLGTEFSNNEPSRAAEAVNATLAAEPDLAGVFGTNLFSAQGAATGARQAGADIRVVGFDAGPAQVDQLEEGLVQALIAQQPAEIGRQAVEQAVAALNGEPVEEEIGTGSFTVTEENLDSPEAQEALYRSEC